MVGQGDVNEYALRTIVSLRELADDEVLILKGRGDNIHKAVDVYNEVKARVGDALKLVGVSIGSEKVGRRRLPYIELKLKMQL